MVCLDDARDVAPQPDPVAAHHDRVALAVLAEIRGAHGHAEVGAQLEDVAHFDAVGQRDGATTLGAGIPIPRVDDIGDHVGREVAPHVDVPEMEALAVGSRNEVRRTRDQVVDHHHGVVCADGRRVARHHPRRADLLHLCRPHGVGLDRVGELGLIDLVVTSGDHCQQASIACHEEGRLGRPVLPDLEGARQIRDRGRAGSRDLLGRHRLLGGRLWLANGRNLPVRRVILVLAQDQGVLAPLVEDHELVREAATHHAHVRPNHNRVEAQPLEDAGVRVVVQR